MRFVIKIILSTLAVLATNWLLPDSMVHIENFKTALLVALALAFLNAVVKPILVFLTIPATLISLGLFLLVINAVIILLADYFIPGFKVGGFWSALLFSIVLALINGLLGGNGRVQVRTNSFNYDSNAGSGRNDDSRTLE
jgi:putative membrane protein